METKRIPLDTMNPTPAPPAQAADPPPDIPAGTAQLNPDEVRRLEEKLVNQLCTCFDPEIPVNIYELGLIYNLEISPAGAVDVKMTLTSPACPVAGTLPGEVKNKLLKVPGVTVASVEVVWDPPWTQDRMTEAAKLQLGLFD
jgi:FeS assembly SUF system protein